MKLYIFFLFLLTIILRKWGEKDVKFQKKRDSMIGKLYQKERGVFAEETFLFCHLQLIIVIIEWYKDILFYKLFQVLFMKHDLQKYTCKKRIYFWTDLFFTNIISASLDKDSVGVL